MSSRKQRDVEKQQFWRLVLEEHAKSGLSVRAFCRQESLSEPSFYSWRQTIRNGGQPDSKKTARSAKGVRNGCPSAVQNHRFAAVHIAGAPSAAASSGHRGIEIVTPENILVRLPGDCSSETIHRVLTALQQQASPC